MSRVEFDNIRKAYGPTVALAGVSFTVGDGEFLVIVGPSGCGKSTLLRVVAGLESPDAGRILMDGADVTERPPKDRGVAMVFQSYALYPHWTVHDNIAFPLKIRRVAKADIDRRVRLIADALQLAAQLTRRPRELSGGQRQRVALGRAMAADPRIFLFDEPLSNLDAPLRAGMRREIVARQKELGKTSLYVTHDQTEALTMADRIVVLESGRLMGIGTPQELYDDPPNRFVAQFLGRPTINMLSATLRHADGAMFVEPLGWRTFSRSGMTWPPTVEVGVRPEHVQLRADGDGRWRIESQEFLGDKVQCVVTDGQRQLTVLAEAHAALPIGATVAPEPRPDRLLFFDPTSGQRLRTAV